jgi:hypothetical protein
MQMKTLMLGVSGLESDVTEIIEARERALHI